MIELANDNLIEVLFLGAGPKIKVISECLGHKGSWCTPLFRVMTLTLNSDRSIVPDPEIWIAGCWDLFFQIFRSRSIHRAHRKFLLAKTIYGLQLLLLAHFDRTPPSWGSPYKCSVM